MPAINSKTEELSGEFSHESVSRGADDSPDRWIVGYLAGAKTVVGNAAKGTLLTGRQYRFLGSWRTHDTYGRQFSFTSFVEVEPTSLAAIQRYLATASGIGPQRAARIVGEYGDQSLVACRERTVEVGLTCGISDELMICLANTLRRGRAIERIMLDVDELLHGCGFPRSLPQKVIEQWGERACEKIRENPYVLRVFQGVGFLKCDALYERLGLPMDALTRQVHCITHALESDLTGSTWLAERVLADELRRKVAGATVKLQQAIEEAINADMIRQRGRHYAVAPDADAESSMVSDLVRAIVEDVDEFGFVKESKWTLTALTPGVEC
jgi:exodeoxyribonuclease V alpha subunit